MKNKYKSVFAVTVALLLAVIFAFTFCFTAIKTTMAVAEVASPSKAMCLMEVSTGRVLASKNADQRLAMASTTKIMTAITAIEHCNNLDEQFEISPNAVGVMGTSMYLRKGETQTIRDLLYGLMLVSGNDASVAIGEKIGGSALHFVDLMNFTAHRIGASHTHFENTHGLDEKGHYTSAKDLASIAAYALKNPVFKEIVSTKNIKLTSPDGKDRYLHNKNKLLSTFDGAIGVKTGFTDDAGRCLVSAAERDGMSLVCVTLNCGPMFEECAKWLQWGFDNFKMVDLTSKLDYAATIEVVDGEKERAKIGHTSTFKYPLTDEEAGKVKFQTKVQSQIEAPLEKGSEVGSFEITFENKLLFSDRIVTMEIVKARSFVQRLKDILDQW